mmetsp:Transcript_8565/g.10281  ORF Transcript_8565/g.10281 Transcript_8565/m.10281 type:complete len:169 (-) Transcript_8565:804-1310(-)
MSYEPIEVEEASQETSSGMVEGRWMVVMEEGMGNIKYYPFDYKDAADRFFASQSFSRILFDLDGEAVSTGGLNPFALSSIRCAVNSQSDGFIEGKWMVAVEKGLGNVCFFPFRTEDKARSFFDSLVFSRVLIDSNKIEVASGGVNPISLYNIRRKISNSNTLSSSVWW